MAEQRLSFLYLLSNVLSRQSHPDMTTAAAAHQLPRPQMQERFYLAQHLPEPEHRLGTLLVEVLSKIFTCQLVREGKELGFGEYRNSFGARLERLVV